MNNCMYKKISKSIIILLLLFICLFIMLKMQSFSGNVIIKEFKTNRTEKIPIANRFLNENDFKECFWQSGIISNGYFDIGPTSYWMHGYIVLNDSKFAEFKKTYKWTFGKTSFDSNKYVLNNRKSIPCLNFKKSIPKNCKWGYSSKFNEYFLNNSYIGKCYLDLNNGILEFDVQNK